MKREEAPPDYSEIEAGLGEASPLLQEPLAQPIPQVSVYPQAAHFVTLTSTNQPVPVRLMDGMMHLTVLEPCRIFCPSCQQHQQTTVVEEANCCAYISCITLSCIAPLLCWVPFCMKDCKNTYHECTNCGTKLAQISLA